MHLTWDTVSASATPGTPTNSFQFNSADTSFSGTETFYFEPSTRDVVLPKITSGGLVQQIVQIVFGWSMRLTEQRLFLSFMLRIL